jgi:uncharacterized protein YbaR (Trm112 family)
MIDPDFLAILACPRCDSRPHLIERGHFLVCPECAHGYKIENGIPHLLVEAAIAPDSLPGEHA